MKQWYTKRADAIKAKEQFLNRGLNFGIYKQKHGRHKGQYFVGSYMEFINKY